MGLFDIFKKKEEVDLTVDYPAVLGAPGTGKIVPMAEIPDPVFSEGILGMCCGVEPSEGKVYAPINGEISNLTGTLHAVGITAAEMEILIHVGVDTVEMKGDGFTSCVKMGQKVKKGDLLLTMDLEKIAAAGHPATIICAVTNSEDFASVELVGSGACMPGDDMLKVSK